jgi:hypothetical protein
MSNINQPAYPTTPEHHGYPSGMEDVHMYSGSGLSKLQRVASEQLAALVLADLTTNKIVSPVEARDLRLDENGDFTIGEKGNAVWLRNSERRAAAVGKRYAVITTPHERMAREAVRYAKALLEMTE